MPLLVPYAKQRDRSTKNNLFIVKDTDNEGITNTGFFASQGSKRNIFASSSAKHALRMRYQHIRSNYDSLLCETGEQKHCLYRGGWGGGGVGVLDKEETEALPVRFYCARQGNKTLSILGPVLLRRRLPFGAHKIRDQFR